MKELQNWAFAQKGIIGALVGLSVLLGTVITGQAYFLVHAVDAVFLQEKAFQAIIPLLGFLLGTMAVRVFITYMNARLGVKLAAIVKRHVRTLLLHKWTSNPIQTAIQGQSGGKVTVMMEAVDSIDSYYREYMPQVIKASIVPLIVLAAVSYTHIWSGVIMMITAPFIPLFYIIIGIKTQKKSEEQLGQLAAFSGQFLDTLQGLQTLKLFGRSARQREEIQRSSLGFREATMDILKIAFTSTLMLEFISTLSIGLIALEIGLRLVVFDSISFVSAFFVLVLAPEYYTALKELGAAFHTGRGSLGASEKIKEELQTDDHAVQWGIKEVTAQPSLALENVEFRYGDGFAVKTVNFRIEPGARVAIVGATGSGKTTLLNIVAGLFDPLAGEVLVDGQPRHQFSEASWFEQISYISQVPYLFSGTIEENILLGAVGQPTREEVEEAVRKAGLKEMIGELKQGLDTSVGEAGRGLSGGEKQRVALARAFLKKPSLVLFDEPTTGLDLKTEQILQRSIDELAETATVITVAHRLHTIQQADVIFLMKRGEVEAAGTHTELLDTSETYRLMVQGGGAQ
ncbi:thiol reductant ABC exporter subunit CydD [Domibacillus enclensis]|uniref:ATP-binding cassette, subfamily C, CydD n=1 Tax=Domibacillus enclensis TaxID=1017273 RepID=A0A1N6XNS5_9BACI|nr:thiol reductant ABC exporter subunit CydD [Domibacillus enclensis]OXS77387.1 thiol reductant ABC exporter subunit CydD [Domibacillus enclensis]SIR03950.1 ATP-binding cassette, subfamily C, CydD [Domibacillus enclensis]